MKQALIPVVILFFGEQGKSRYGTPETLSRHQKLAARRNFLSQQRPRKNKSNLLNLTYGVVKIKTTRHEYA